ncbi:hypothetical protein DM01DRAFT_1219228 [Hesseltinella vesiculosa]|uniref:Uncharacterized protein n=1 Tax=Hesseltinella vesiculosa TaxID=101127 RepID=A0A1X2GNX6_9FUNG|nr:hypothetical protein DM01DRAFT_1219228 [Hesseltinella vesiculosa]
MYENKRYLDETLLLGPCDLFQGIARSNRGARFEYLVEIGQWRQIYACDYLVNCALALWKRSKPPSTILSNKPPRKFVEFVFGYGQGFITTGQLKLL